MKLSESFYQQSDVVKVARELLGKELITNIQNKITSGIIVETEAYSWKEKGCHAYNNRKTTRNAVMFQPGGFSYVYLCYGIHHLVNVVTGGDGVAEAVLIRALEPRTGVALMQERMNTDSDYRITSGPGKLTKALGIDRSLNGKYLLGDDLWIEDSGIKVGKSNIVASKRIGIDYAGEDAHLPWRFTIKDNTWVSRR
ncbi:MAG: DNA-3-methyladenine glycosylase [Azospira oryzae]|jgi:DNA-3-methyladenine glycosylase|nr:MAG: DNA-3-methyladenine glycosylase [Azospira oryzae]